MTADFPAPALSLAASASVLTEEKLTRTRWSMGVSGRGELTGAFHFGADGRIKSFKSFNEATWRLRGGVLEIFDEQGALAWCFDLVFQLGGGQTALFSGYRKPTEDTGVSLYLLEQPPAAPLAAAGDVAEPVRPVAAAMTAPAAAPAVAPAAAAPAAGDAARGAGGPAKALTVCIRGACELGMIAGVLRGQAEMVEELTFGYQGWEICALPRIIALAEEMRRPENREIVARLPGMPAGRFESDLIAGGSDAYVLSFSQESLQGIYQSKSTGMILPMGHFGLNDDNPTKLDYTKITFEEIMARGIRDISEEQWAFFRDEFSFRGGFNEALFMMDVIEVFTRLKERGKQVVILGLNAAVGRDRPILAFFAKINAIVRPLAREFGFASIDVNDFIRAESDLAADDDFGGALYAREVYVKISNAVLAALRAPRHAIADAA